MGRLRVVSSLVLTLSFLACGGNHGGDDDDDGTGGALTISPAAATVALTAGADGYTASQAFTVTQTQRDGSTVDVTARCAWSSDDDHVSVTAGATTITAAGPYHVSAELDGARVDATLTGTLHATGNGPGFDPGDAGKLDGAPDAARAPRIAYPVAGALVPVNVAPLEVHVEKQDAAQTLARVDLTSGDVLAYRFYTRCAATVPNPRDFPAACILTLDHAFAAQLAGASEAGDIQITVRLAAADGSKLGESPAIALAWSRVALTGGLYYWTTAGSGDTFNTGIARYDFNGDASAPTIYLSSDSAPKVPAGQPQCIGCHAVSPDGAKLSFSLGGSTPGFFSLFDVATTQPTQSRFTDKFADMSTFSPDGARMVTMSYGKLTLRTADASLAVVADDLFATTVNEKMSHPFWGPSGGHFAFVSWIPSAADIQSGHNTGDMVQGGQLWIADSNGTEVGGTPRLLVPRADGITSYYPAISDDDRFVVFNRSRCDGPANSTSGWGLGPCDGYQDISATLNLVPTTGGPPIPLTRANGGDDPRTTNSWPRWSPDHGTFRGKRLYWVAFSSRRPYGLALPGSKDDKTKPQLWFAAVAVDPNGAAPTEDPSFAPIWLPGQDPSFTGPRGNHTPAWTSKVVIIQ